MTYPPNHPQLHLAFDLDNVVTDWDGGFRSEWTKRRPETPPLPFHSRVHFYIDEDYPEHERDFVTQVHRSKGFYRNLPPNPTALSVLRTLDNMGVDMILLTAPEVHVSCGQEKMEWIEEHLGPTWIPRAHIGRDKTRVRATHLIDDKPTITGAFEPVWEHLVFDAPYNRGVEGKRRVTWATLLPTLGLATP